MWTLDGHAQLLPQVPPWFFHDVRDVDGDQLPDLLTHGPFRSQLPSNCGVRDCPSELKGPELLAHNLGKGFSFTDAASAAHLKQSCKQLSGSALEQMATQGVCRRLQGDTVDAILEDVDKQRTKLCKNAKQCPALDIMSDWIRAPLPKLLR